MMNRLVKNAIGIVFTLLAVVACYSQENGQHGRLRVTSDGHFLEYQDGTPFFWLGDTGWELFHKLDRAEIEKYLENRNQKGFNVIQAVILHNRDGESPDHPPLIDEDPDKPNEKYFALIDWTVQKALEKKMVMALLPCWGDVVTGIRTTIPPMINEKNAYTYGKFLGSRYKSYPNIVWITGGDNPAFVDTADWRPVWRSMIRGLREGSEDRALITYHPWGENSSTAYWKDENTLDFNMMQSGHRTHDLPVWTWITRDRQYTPPKPIIDGEPNYEDHPVNWDKKNGYFRDYDVRKQLYRSVFSGAAGVTYGHHAIWQFYKPSDKQPITYADRYWTEALDRPAAFQAGYLKELILSRSANERIPDQSIIIYKAKNAAGYSTAFRGADSSYAMLYIPVGEKIAVRTLCLKGDKVIVSWFDPKNNRYHKAGALKKSDVMTFTPPTLGTGNDWVLILSSD